MMMMMMRVARGRSQMNKDGMEWNDYTYRS